MATARQSGLSVTQCVAPAFARPLAEDQERATAGMRPLPGGRWLMGFKDLWLTGPLSASKAREIRAFERGPTTRFQGIVNTIN